MCLQCMFSDLGDEHKIQDEVEMEMEDEDEEHVESMLSCYCSHLYS